MNKHLMRRVMQRLRNLKPTPAMARFIQHNRRVFPTIQTEADAPVVLMEFNEMHSSHIAYSYLANALAQQANARVVAYLPRALSTRWERLSFGIRSSLGLDTYGIYRSFGAVEFLTIAPDSQQCARAAAMLPSLLQGLNSKSDLEALTIDGVWIGDLVYDTYLMRYRRPTVDVASEEFRSFLLESLECFVFWQDYIARHRIVGINVSHCVYNLAMLLRLAVQRDIPVFQASLTHVYRLNRDELFAYNDFQHYRERCAALPVAVRQAGLAQARDRIERRFAGEVGVDMHYSTRSAYGKSRHAQLLKPSQRKKLLVATHCFFDSPHSFGNNLFPDFWEWLEFLGQLSNQTDYDWYIKTHPDYLPGTMEIIQAFIARYPKFTLLPSDASHHQIIAEGIDVALTVYGTIAFEYAALGKPVINCSVNNPHVAYDFNLHPRSVDEYRLLLFDLDHLPLNIQRDEVYEYYFMHHLYNTQDLFLDNYADTVAAMGGYDTQFTPAMFDQWLAQWSPQRHSQLMSALRHFIYSGDFRMEYSHRQELPQAAQTNAALEGRA
jgi:hypothetical protein